MALIGCGGTGPGGGNGGGGGGGGGGNGRSSINTNLLNKPGRVEVTFNSGQGRAPGSLIAAIRHFELQDEIGIVETQLRGELRVQLDGYTSQSIEVNVPMDGFSPNLASRNFDTLPLEVQRLGLEDNFGNYAWYDGTNGQPIFADSFTLHARAFPGRYTAIELFIDDAILSLDLGAVPVPVALFDRERFELINYDQNDLHINGWLADYISFDISNVANKPIFSPSGPYSGETVTMAHFSGDSYAISVDPVAGGAAMEVLTTGVDPFEALISPQATIPGLGVMPGTFTIRQVDPRDLSGIAKITALQGIWRWWHDSSSPSRGFILDPGLFEVFTIPSSEDNEKQEIIMLSRNIAGQIIELYYGEIDYELGEFHAWPIENIDDGDIANEISGSVSGIVYRPGGPFNQSDPWKDIRSGTITITTGTPPPSFLLAPTEFLVIRL